MRLAKLISGATELVSDVTDAAFDHISDHFHLGSTEPNVITASGNFLFVLGRGGDDIITATAEPGGLWGNTILAGAGNDSVTIYGDRNVAFGGTGNDDFYVVGTDSGPGRNNVVYGDEGDDTINASSIGTIIHGGIGNDVLSLGGTGNRDNFGFGGDGDDTLYGTGLATTIDGGSGNDQLIGTTFSLTPEVDAGITMTGGAGLDSFTAWSSTYLTAEGDLDGQISQGDVITGVISAITDYEAGERVTLDVFPQGTRALHTGPVLLGEPPPAQSTPALILNQGEYALIRGELSSPGHFAVSESGGDLLLVAAALDTGGQPAAASSAVAFLNATTEDILIA
ncbi:MAG TPA: hypothetical protein VNZ61_06515 [Roseomonas sp.]|nr:hypothetical protein [Roseomonas sp.]